MLRKLRNLFKDERGEDMIEYALLAAFISIAAIALLRAIGPLLVTIYTNVKNALTP
jgi:Flp pilus assembly pilin Flp